MSERLRTQYNCLVVASVGNGVDAYGCGIGRNGKWPRVIDYDARSSGTSMLDRGGTPEVSERPELPPTSSLLTFEWCRAAL